MSRAPVAVKESFGCNDYCRYNKNSDQVDRDADDFDNICYNFPNVPNPDQAASDDELEICLAKGSFESECYLKMVIMLRVTPVIIAQSTHHMINKTMTKTVKEMFVIATMVIWDLTNRTPTAKA